MAKTQVNGKREGIVRNHFLSNWNQFLIQSNGDCFTFVQVSIVATVSIYEQ